jgi:hypothetical protein
MKKRQMVNSILAGAFLAAMAPAFAQSATGVQPTPAAVPNPTAPVLPSAKPKCVNAPINNVPKDCAPDVTIGATGNAAASRSSADIAKQSSDANASVGIGSTGTTMGTTSSSGIGNPKPTDGTVKTK